MDDNPYASPRVETPVVGVLSGSREDLRSVAKSQKGILVCILIYIIAVIARLLLPDEIRLILSLSVVVVGIAATVFAFQLAIRVYGTGAGIGLGILTLIPIIGLLVLLIINGKATRILRANGIKVGLLGANLAEV